MEILSAATLTFATVNVKGKVVLKHYAMKAYGEVESG
jgi:hypothetical protein